MNDVVKRDASITHRKVPTMEVKRAGWVIVALAALISSGTAATAQSGAPAPPTDLQATDYPWDNGTKIDLEWVLSPECGLAFWDVRFPAPLPWRSIARRVRI